MIFKNLFKDLKDRGIVFQHTENNLEENLERPLKFYCGFDPTADSLHIGTLLPLLTMRRLQLAGHTPYLLVGGATGMVGDPSGKTQERVLLSTETINKNLEGIKKVASRFLSFSGSNAVRVVNNIDWIGKISVIDFLRETGKHFTVNHMLAKESVRARLEDREHGISFTEFTYMLLQAYDFQYLFEHENCVMQIGGSDQWGNITAGVELIRRTTAAKKEEASNTYAFTFPMVTKSDGKKFGKSESGTVWLDSEKTSPYQFYQFLLQTPDSDVIKLLKYFSFRSLKEISELEKRVKEAPESREAQHALAREITELVHSAEEVRKIEEASTALFKKDLVDLDLDTLQRTFSEAPRTNLQRSELQNGLSLVDLLVKTTMCSSKGAARREIEGGGINLNDVRVSDAAYTVTAKDLLFQKLIVLRKGKKGYHIVHFG